MEKYIPKYQSIDWWNDFAGNLSSLGRVPSRFRSHKPERHDIHYSLGKGKDMTPTTDFVQKYGYNIVGIDGQLILSEVAALYTLADWGFPKDKLNAMIKDINEMYGTQFLGVL